MTKRHHSLICCLPQKKCKKRCVPIVYQCLENNKTTKQKQKVLENLNYNTGNLLKESLYYNILK